MALLLSNESQILEKALAALTGETGIILDVQSLKGTDVDVYLRIRHQETLVRAEIKRGLKPANLGAIVHQLTGLKQPCLLITDYVTPNIGKKLKEKGIQFIDSCGNAYLNLPSIYVHVIGQKPPQGVLGSKRSKNKAFDVTGLKLIYGFLCDDSLINASYREISERTGVALGSIGKLLVDIKDAGYLLNKSDMRCHGLINRRKLLDRWMESYSEKLKPGLLFGEFTCDDPNWWKNIDIERFGAYWGAEVAAAKYTDYLRPQEITVYLPEESSSTFFSVARLRKFNNAREVVGGLIKVYRPFWSERKGDDYPNYFRNDSVHPILIYADLIASADSRNLETARMLYDSTIAEYIGED